MDTFEKIYNALKDYCISKSNTRWTVGHIKFHTNYLNAPYCSFDIMSKYDQELLGQCYFCLIDKDNLVVSFKTYKDDIDDIGNVYPKITLPQSRYEYPDDVLGRYFYLLIDELYYMTSFQAARLKFFLQMVKQQYII